MRKKTLKTLFLMFLTWFFVHEIVIVSDGLTDENSRADIAVIFGNTVHPDGTISDRLTARLDRGIELYEDSLVQEFFVSGGFGKEGHYEGDKMAEYLLKNQIPKEVIKIDNQGNTTSLTTQNFKERFGTNKSVIVVSQFYHISRAKLSFRKEGIEMVSGAHCDYFESRDFYACFREFFGYYKYLLFH